MGLDSKTLGAALMIAGVTIGGALLALPLASATVGFLPSSLIILLVWFFSFYAANLFIEITFWGKAHKSLLSLFAEYFSPTSLILVKGLFLYLLVALCTGYSAGTVDFIAHLFGFAEGSFEVYGCALLVVLGMATLFKMGSSHVDYANRFFSVLLYTSLSLCTFFLFDESQVQRLAHYDFAQFALVTPIILTSFGFHVIIPSISHHLDWDPKRVVLGTGLGITIPLIVYLVWNFTVMSTLPSEGEFGLISAYVSGTPIQKLFDIHLNSGIFFKIILTLNIFVVSAILTSFLGVGLSLMDCVMDAFPPKTGTSHWGLAFVTMAVPMTIGMTNQRAFLLALEYAGVYGVVGLLMFLPGIVVWRNRPCYKESSQFQAFGGKWMLIALFCFCISMFALKIALSLDLWSFTA